MKILILTSITLALGAGGLAACGGDDSPCGRLESCCNDLGGDAAGCGEVSESDDAQCQEALDTIAMTAEILPIFPDSCR